MKWFKFYCQDWLTDIKIMSLSIEDRLCYITLLCLAAASDEPGVVRNCTEYGILKLTHLYNDPYDTDNEYTRAVGCLGRFVEKGMVTVDASQTVTVVNFRKRQEEYSTSAERMRRKRARDKMAQDSHIFSGDGGVTGVTSHSDARIEENRREYKKETPKVVSPLKESTEHKVTDDDLGNVTEVDITVVETDEDGNELTRKGRKPILGKDPYREVILRIVSKFDELCKKNLGMNPTGGKGVYNHIKGALTVHKLSEENAMDICDEWFSLNKPDAIAWDIMSAFSRKNINDWRIRNQ